MGVLVHRGWGTERHGIFGAFSGPRRLTLSIDRSSKVRLLYLADKRGDSRQVGPRKTFERLAGRGSLAAYEAFAPWLEADRYGTTETHLIS